VTVAAALIVIEIAAPNVSDEALSVLVSSCTRAAREAECVLTKNASDEQPAAVAIVSQQGENKMRVEVGVRQGDHDSWHTKEFAFLAVDALEDRWRAVGFAIGTLAEDNPPPAAPVAQTKPEPPPPIAPVTVPPPPSIGPKPKPKPGPQLFLGVSAIFGPGLQGVASGPWRAGSTLYADLALPRVPIFCTFGGSAATRISSDATGAAVRWFDVSAGAGVGLLGGLGDSGLELRAQLLAEEFDVSVSGPDGRSDERGRWVFGFQGELGGRLRIVPDFLLTAGISAADISSATDVLVSGTPVGSASNFRALGSLGMRVRLR
jgi:hypothetical protein